MGIHRKVMDQIVCGDVLAGRGDSRWTVTRVWPDESSDLVALYIRNVDSGVQEWTYGKVTAYRFVVGA
jgi:hypothetical protein